MKYTLLSLLYCRIGSSNDACTEINISRGISFVGDMSEMAIHSKAEKFVKQMRKILN